MFTGYRSLARSLLVGSLVATNLFTASMARSGTSVHKVKKKLHQVEHASGVVLSQAGQLIGMGLANVTVEVDVSLRDNEDRRTEPSDHKPGPVQAPANHSSAAAKPPRTTHPAK